MILCIICLSCFYPKQTSELGLVEREVLNKAYEGLATWNTWLECNQQSLDI